ncbi:hypothetical protein LTS18_013258 [Coniosporium uncinatum]|uniref:Uncharacterized protein n=1 Tax=Coniosporium uncinatum TaxID=93489 RepID=A0ACC3DI69_9PEZI|nr:hypothetical protein LTS18_013258 [Coniosporium uncinatum]
MSTDYASPGGSRQPALHVEPGNDSINQAQYRENQGTYDPVPSEDSKRDHQQSGEEEARQQRAFEETRKAEGQTSSREPLDEASLPGKAKAKFEHFVHHHDDQETVTEKRR